MVIAKQAYEDFISELGSSEPTPGGGSAAALVGAAGIALGKMAMNLTMGKPKYAAVEDKLHCLQQRAAALAAEMLALADADAVALLPLTKAYGLQTPEAEKQRLLEHCLHEAAQPPLAIMRCASRALALLAQLATMCSPLMISDVGCGAALSRAALEAAALNVWINAKWMQNKDKATALMAETDAMIAEYVPLAQMIYQQAAERCRPCFS